MRIEGEIDHPEMKITIFKAGDRYSVKFENAGLEITYKFSYEEGATDLGKIKEMMDEDFLSKVWFQLKSMIPVRLEKIREFLPDETEDEFDEII